MGDHFTADMTLHLVSVIGEHTELAELGAIPGRFLETHGRVGTGPEKATDVSVTAVAYAPRPFMRVASVVPDKGELGVCH